MAERTVAQWVAMWAAHSADRSARSSVGYLGAEKAARLVVMLECSLAAERADPMVSQRAVPLADCWAALTAALTDYLLVVMTAGRWDLAI